MPTTPAGRFAYRLAAPAVPDAELVRRYADGRCEAAFAELVRRHGPAVYAICRRTVGDHHLAEDAFQAVFVVLARKADGIDPPGAVGGWLRGVARKAAAEARAVRRRRCREHLPGTLPDRAVLAPEPDDTPAAVAAAVADLPEPLRSAVRRCELDGLSRTAAAAELGIPEGTLSSRLAKARRLLADRLHRHAPLAVPAALNRAAVASAGGRATTNVTTLANEVLRTMLRTQLRSLTVMGLAAVALTGGMVSTLSPAPAAPRRAAPVPEKRPAWKHQFTMTHDGPVTAVALGRELIATFDADRGKPRLWAAKDGAESALEVRGARFPNAPARLLRFTQDDRFLLMVVPYELEGGPAGDASRYEWRAGGVVNDCMSGFYPLGSAADLSVSINRKYPLPNQPVQRDRLFVHGNPWIDRDHYRNHTAVYNYPGGKAITHADLSADGRRMVVAGEDNMIRIIDRENLQERHTITLNMDAKLTSIRMFPDGERFVIIGENGLARVYPITAGGKPVELRGQTGPVTAVAVRPDGKRVATAAGRVVRVFDAATGAAAGVIDGHADVVRGLACDVERDRLVTVSDDRTAKVWERAD